MDSASDEPCSTCGNVQGHVKGTMRAGLVVSEREIEVREIPVPPPPQADEVQVRIRAVALNHIDVWGWRGMA